MKKYNSIENFTAISVHSHFSNNFLIFFKFQKLFNLEKDIRIHDSLRGSTISVLFSRVLRIKYLRQWNSALSEHQVFSNVSVSAYPSDRNEQAFCRIVWNTKSASTSTAILAKIVWEAKTSPLSEIFRRVLLVPPCSQEIFKLF